MLCFAFERRETFIVCGALSALCTRKKWMKSCDFQGRFATTLPQHGHCILAHNSLSPQQLYTYIHAKLIKLKQSATKKVF